MKSNLKFSKFLLTICIAFSAFSASAQLTGVLGSNLPTMLCEGEQSFVQVFVTNGIPPYEVTYHDGNSTQTISGSDSPVIIPISTLTPGFHNFDVISVEDANAEVAIIDQQFTVQVSALPQIFIIPSQSIACVGDLIVFTPIGGITYTWSNGIIDGTFIATTPGSQTIFLTGTNQSGCVNTTMTTISVLPSPAMNPPTASIDSAHCNDGSITLDVQQPASYSVSWSTGTSTSPFLTGLSAGNYTATLTDTNGCTYSLSYNVPQTLLPTACGTVKGTVIYDMDQSCSETSGDVMGQYKVIIANPGNYLALSDMNGNYELNLDAGTYTIHEVINVLNVGAFCNQNQTITVVSGQIVENVNFMDTLSDEVDLYAWGILTQVRPNFNFDFLPIVGNLLPIHEIEDTPAWFTFPSDVVFLSWNHPHTISNDTVYFNVGNGNAVPSYATFYASNLLLGDSVTFCTGIQSSNWDIDVSNDIQYVSTIAVGSYDPNDKTTFVNGVPTDGTIYMEDQTLDYIIRFQNTGTADAINVSVLDTIHAELNLSSFDLISTSHACNLILLEDNVLKFDFPSIHLPDSTTDEAGSHGYIHYKIRQNPGNTIGTEIKNTAYIYFDFNEAVITNTTNDIIVDPAGLNEMTDELIQLYPNPTGGKFTVSASSEIKAITILGLNGQVLMIDNPKENQAEMDLSNLSKGVYLIKIETQHGVALKKVQRN